MKLNCGSYRTSETAGPPQGRKLLVWCCCGVCCMCMNLFSHCFELQRRIIIITLTAVAGALQPQAPRPAATATAAPAASRAQRPIPQAEPPAQAPGEPGEPGTAPPLAPPPHNHHHHPHTSHNHQPRSSNSSSSNNNQESRPRDASLCDLRAKARQHSAALHFHH